MEEHAVHVHLAASIANGTASNRPWLSPSTSACTSAQLTPHQPAARAPPAAAQVSPRLLPGEQCLVGRGHPQYVAVDPVNRERDTSPLEVEIRIPISQPRLNCETVAMTPGAASADSSDKGNAQLGQVKLYALGPVGEATDIVGNPWDAAVVTNPHDPSKQQWQPTAPPVRGLHTPQSSTGTDRGTETTTTRPLLQTRGSPSRELDTYVSALSAFGCHSRCAAARYAAEPAPLPPPPVVVMAPRGRSYSGVPTAHISRPTLPEPPRQPWSAGDRDCQQAAPRHGASGSRSQHELVDPWTAPEDLGEEEEEEEEGDANVGLQAYERSAPAHGIGITAEHGAGDLAPAWCTARTADRWVSTAVASAAVAAATAAQAAEHNEADLTAAGAAAAIGGEAEEPPLAPIDLDLAAAEDDVARDAAALGVEVPICASVGVEIIDPFGNVWDPQPSRSSLVDVPGGWPTLRSTAAALMTAPSSTTTTTTTTSSCPLTPAGVAAERVRPHTVAASAPASAPSGCSVGRRDVLKWNLKLYPLAMHSKPLHPTEQLRRRRPLLQPQPLTVPQQMLFHVPAAASNLVPLVRQRQLQQYGEPLALADGYLGWPQAARTAAEGDEGVGGAKNFFGAAAADSAVAPQPAEGAGRCDGSSGGGFDPTADKPDDAFGRPDPVDAEEPYELQELAGPHVGKYGLDVGTEMYDMTQGRAAGGRSRHSSEPQPHLQPHRQQHPQPQLHPYHVLEPHSLPLSRNPPPEQARLRQQPLSLPPLRAPLYTHDVRVAAAPGSTARMVPVVVGQDWEFLCGEATAPCMDMSRRCAAALGAVPSEYWCVGGDGGAAAQRPDGMAVANTPRSFTVGPIPLTEDDDDDGGGSDGGGGTGGGGDLQQWQHQQQCDQPLWDQGGLYVLPDGHGLSLVVLGRGNGCGKRRRSDSGLDGTEEHFTADEGTSDGVEDGGKGGRGTGGDRMGEGAVGEEAGRVLEGLESRLRPSEQQPPQPARMQPASPSSPPPVQAQRQRRQRQQYQNLEQKADLQQPRPQQHELQRRSAEKGQPKATPQRAATQKAPERADAAAADAAAGASTRSNNQQLQRWRRRLQQHDGPNVDADIGAALKRTAEAGSGTSPATPRRGRLGRAKGAGTAQLPQAAGGDVSGNGGRVSRAEAASSSLREVAAALVDLSRQCNHEPTSEGRRRGRPRRVC